MNNNARAILDALTELIDTLWNVNIDGLVITYDDVEN